MCAELLPKPLRRLARHYFEQLGFVLASAGAPNLHTAMRLA